MTAWTVPVTDGALSAGGSDFPSATRLIQLAPDVVGLADPGAAKTTSGAISEDSGFTDSPPPTAAPIHLLGPSLPADSSGLTDGSALFGYQEIDTDALGITDGFTFRRTLVFTDTAGVTESQVWDRAVSFQETFAVDDAQGLFNNSPFLTFNETAGMTDDANVVSLLFPLDIVGVADTITRYFSPGASTDAAGLSDSVAFEIDPQFDDDSGSTDPTALTFRPTTVYTDDPGLLDYIGKDISMVVNEYLAMHDVMVAGQPREYMNISVLVGL